MELKFGFKGFKPGETLDASEEPACPVIGGHCWHPALVQHAMMHHRDDTCRHCGAGRCVNWQPTIPPGHGKFHPRAL